MMRGRAWVGTKLVCEAEMMAQVAKINKRASAINMKIICIFAPLKLTS